MVAPIDLNQQGPPCADIDPTRAEKYSYCDWRMCAGLRSIACEVPFEPHNLLLSCLALVLLSPRNFLDCQIILHYLHSHWFNRNQRPSAAWRISQKWMNSLIWTSSITLCRGKLPLFSKWGARILLVFFTLVISLGHLLPTKLHQIWEFAQFYSSLPPRNTEFIPSLLKQHLE